MTVLKLRIGVFIVVAVLLNGVMIFAQSGQADVQGVVSDVSGSLVTDAEVVLVNSDSGDKRTVKTGQDGRYSFPTVAPGHYAITVTAATFSPKTISGLNIQLDNHINQAITLQVGSESQTVSVSGAVQAVDTTAYDVGGVISQAQIDTLPIQNRQYLNLALLIPGTSQDASRTFYNNVQTGGGEYFYANGFYLDGVTNQQTEEGDPRQNIPEGAVGEFKTYTASFPAELGWAMGGFTTVVTKSGTNKIHGEAFEYYRGQFMNADNQFTQQTELADHVGSPAYNRNQYGFDIGGPILKDKLHYYGAFERTQQTTSYTLFAPGNSAADFGAVTGTFRTPGHDQMLTLRLDDDITSNQQLFVRYAQEWNLVSGNGCGGSTTIGCYDGQIPRHAIVVGHTWEPSARIVNEARFQYAYISYELGPYGTPVPTKPTDLINPAYTKNVSVAYQFLDFGYGANYAAVGVESRWEVNDSVSIEKGAHSLKVGFDASYVPYVDASASNLNGTFYFHNDQPFNPANTSNLTNPYQFTQSAVPLLYYLPSTQASYFAEDSWKARKNLTINLGLRYDRQYGAPFLDTYTPNTTTEPVIPGEGNPHDRGDRNNFGPRVGVSYDPSGKGRDVIRAGYGVYYNFIQTELSEAEKLNFVACPITIVSSTNNVGYPNPYGGQSVTSYCHTSRPNVTILSPGLSNPYEHQFSVGYSRALSSNLSISADGLYNHGLRDYKVYDLNYPNAAGVRPDSALNQISQHASTGVSEYKALYIKLNKSLSNRYMYTASYALSSGLDNNPHAAPVGYANPQADFGPASIDRRHAIVLSGSVLLPWKILVGGIYTFRSAEPFSVLSTATNSDGTTQYVPGTTRNQGNRGISYSAINTYRAARGLNPVSAASVASTKYQDFDLRISKSVFERESMKLEIIGQAFNLFGNENYTSITTAGNSASFGAPTAAGTVQIGELAAKFTF
jgi:Carboxypeptidase regulatory-like domain